MYLNVDVRQCQTETAKLPEITSSPRSIVLQWVCKKCEFIDKNLIFSLQYRYLIKHIGHENTGSK